MISTATMRRLSLWLIGLYALAVIGGVVPLIDVDSAHAGTPSTVSEHKGCAVPAQHHHAGDADDAAHHHVLQDLIGVFAWLPVDETPVLPVPAIPTALSAIVEAD